MVQVSKWKNGTFLWRTIMNKKIMQKRRIFKVAQVIEAQQMDDSDI